tara:strand:- start:366 stop:1484 length:1119 start_codon:yes stop_codon:yes gene_type:complete
MIIPNLTHIELTKLINQYEFKKIIIFSGKNSFYKSGASKILDIIDKKKIIKIIFKRQIIPRSNELKNLTKEFKLFKPDLVIAVGGGAVLDYAKILNVLQDDENLEEKIKSQRVYTNKKNFFLIALPTTAGSGAEVTSNAVIYVGDIKYSIEGENIKPDNFFLISDLILTNPKKLKSSSGFDAIAQAIESLLSIKSNNESVKFALESLKISTKNYLNFINSPNKENSSSMLIAANLAGKAINISKTTAPHAVSYPFTSLFNISHGHAVSLTLNEFLSFNLKKINHSKSSFDLMERYKMLFNVFKVKHINDFNLSLVNLKKSASLENDFNKLGINLDVNMDRIINGLNEQRLKNNPINCTKYDIRDILLSKLKK